MSEYLKYWIVLTNLPLIPKLHFGVSENERKKMDEHMGVRKYFEI